MAWRGIGMFVCSGHCEMVNETGGCRIELVRRRIVKGVNYRVLI